MRGDECRDVMRMGISRHQFVARRPRPRLDALVHRTVLPQKRCVLEPRGFRRVRNQHRLIARLWPQVMIDREYDELGTFAACRPPLRGQVHQRQTVGAAGHGERKPREARQGREQLLGLFPADG